MSTQQQQEEMKTISWVSKNEHLINFTMTQEEWEAQHVEPESDTDEEEWTEYEVEYGYMIDDETGGKSYSERYDNKEDAKEYYDMLVRNEDYDVVWLIERTMEGEDCMDDETIECWDNKCGECRHLCDRV